MSNILKAFTHIVNNYQSTIATLGSGNNRANSMGEGLERFIQNAFANTFEENNKIKESKSTLRVFLFRLNIIEPLFIFNLFCII